MREQFAVDGPLEVYVELRRPGTVRVDAGDTDQAVVEVGGDATGVLVEHVGGRLAIVCRSRTGFAVSGAKVGVQVSVPRGSVLVAELGAASLVTTGPLADVRVRTGSGTVRLDEVTGTTVVRAASGSVAARALGAASHVKAGSGWVHVDELGGEAQLVTGSGPIQVDRARSDLRVKCGSGDIAIGAAEGRARLTTASGTVRVGRLARGRLDVRNVSGDIRVGIPTATPVWTDLRSTSGRVTSGLPAVGPPTDDQEHLEVRALSVSGDIHLEPATSLELATREQP